MKKSIVLLVLLLVMLLMSCETADILTGNAEPNKEWNLIEESAMDSIVNLYITDTDEAMRAWLTSELYEHLETKYNIELVVKMMTFDDIVQTLENEKANEVKGGSIDILLLRDNEFTLLKNDSLLYEQVSEKIPNLEININKLELDIKTEHGTPLDSYGIPFGREQFVLMFDEDELEIFPTSTDELLDFLIDNPGKFSYPNPVTDSTGAEFIRTVIYEIVGQEPMLAVFDQDYTKDDLKALIQPALDYLKELDMYVLKDEEKQYYKKLSLIDELFLSGDLYFSMSSDFAFAEDAIKAELYPDGASAFMFEEGTISDTSYLAIPMNASNKTGGIVTINELLSAELQLNKYVPGNWGNLPILDLKLMNDTDIEAFERASVRRNALRVETLFTGRYPELPLDIQNMINELWQTEIN